MSNYEAPDGFILTRHEGYYMDSRGFRSDEKPDNPWPDSTPDKPFLVAHFDEDTPFTAAHGPNVTQLPIEGGWVPAVYTLTHEDDPTPKVEPANPLAEEKRA